MTAKGSATRSGNGISKSKRSRRGNSWNGEERRNKQDSDQSETIHFLRQKGWHLTEIEFAGRILVTATDGASLIQTSARTSDIAWKSVCRLAADLIELHSVGEKLPKHRVRPASY